MVFGDFSYDPVLLMGKADQKMFATVTDIPVKTFVEPFAFEKFIQ